MDVPNGLLTELALHIESYLNTNLPPAYELRNYKGTIKIVQTCDFISVNTDLSKDDRIKICMAAWFLYAGFCGDPENYQPASAELARQYFIEKGLAEETIQEVCEIILATRYPQQPVTIQSQVLCDAENSWLADKTFLQSLKYLRKEKLLIGKKEIPEKDWLADNISMLENQIYFIPFSRKTFEKGKEKNLLRLKDKPESPDSSRTGSQELLARPKINEKSKLSFPEDLKFERGVETLFRNTSRNQIHLIRLADYKANLIISINSIIISVILSVLVIKLETNKYLELPTLILVLTNVATILIAISATRPKINRHSGDGSQSKVFSNNLLYFGNFQKMSFEEFERDISKTIIDKNDLYSSLTRDIYHQGILLTKKYRHINLSYTVFIIGLILTVLSFILSFLYHINTI